MIEHDNTYLVRAAAAAVALHDHNFGTDSRVVDVATRPGEVEMGARDKLRVLADDLFESVDQMQLDGDSPGKIFAARHAAAVIELYRAGVDVHSALAALAASPVLSTLIETSNHRAWVILSDARAAIRAAEDERRLALPAVERLRLHVDDLRARRREADERGDESRSASIISALAVNQVYAVGIRDWRPIADLSASSSEDADERGLIADMVAMIEAVEAEKEAR